MRKKIINLMIIKRHLIFLLVAIALIFSAAQSQSELLERVVAVVNDDAILLSDFNRAFRQAQARTPKVTRESVLNDMVDRLLLLNQAKKFGLDSIKGHQENRSEDSLIRNYIERRIKILIHIPFDEIEEYYNDNVEQFPDADLFEVKDEIEKHLAERALKIKLLRHIKELRGQAFIRLQL